ncbi:phage tail protein [Escherichia coli]|nr:phage tail protein [Escherichia coli]HAN2043679.1 phage tail protein [Escherichia coli]
MATKYYAVLTNVGAAKLANATALGAQVEITQMAVGDGNGALPTPNPAQTALVHELRRKPLNSLSIDPNNANQIIAEQVIPEDEGGWWIREIGLFDKDGDMIAVANCAETYKPQLQEGSGRVQVVRMILIVSSTAAVTLKIDPSVVLATRQYVDDQIIQAKAYVDHQLTAHVAEINPHKQYAPLNSPALIGTPTAPTQPKADYSTKIATTEHVKAVVADYAPLNSPVLMGKPTAPTAGEKDNSTQIANTSFVQAALAALVGSSPEALDTLNELAAALGNDPNFATTVTNELAGKMAIARNGEDIADKTAFVHNIGLSATGQYTDNLLFTGPDGMKIQVFRRTLANSPTIGTINTVPVTFPVPFPVNCWGVFATKLTWVQVATSCEWVSNTGFTAQVVMNIQVGTTTSDAMFLAVGY